MTFDHNQYVPSLRWKQGEYQAVLSLSSSSRDLITPLIEVPEIGYDFEKKSESKTIDEHLKPFAKRVRAKWGSRLCFVDAQNVAVERTMDEGRHPVAWIFDSLRAAKCCAVPVTGLTRPRDYQQAVKRTSSKDKRGLCLRLRIEEAGKPGLKDATDGVLRKSAAEVENCDLILDLGAPNFQPLEGFAKLVESLIRRLPYLARWRTFTLLATSFPSTMAEIKCSPATIPRFEWLLFKRLIARLQTVSARLPAFGDYAINHPDLITMDMRLVKPAATIRYTTDEGWLILKGPNVRDNGYEQFRDHCRAVIDSPCYLGPTFSMGDKYISECAAGTVSTGNLTTWRKVGTNHHLEKVVHDISSLYGSSSAS